MCSMAPAVFAVDDNYLIMLKTERKSVMWVKVGEHTFYDHSNGILRSDCDVHKVVVPAKLLDSVGSYTVCEREMIERKPYFSETSDVEERVFEFFSVKGDKIRAYHISDAHNKTELPINAARAYGKIDFLILNGDVPDHSGDVKNFDNIYEICDKLTHGNIPVVFSRGNHDMRGVCAEKLENYTPVSASGKSYFTVRLGGFWGLVLDCGEDKEDSCAEYGNTICCHAFREEETAFIEKIADEGSFSDDGVFCRGVICHSPFTEKFEGQFDVENEIYDRWAELLREKIKPDIMICGHMHKISINEPGCEVDHRGQACTVAVASETNYTDYFAGAGFEFNKNGETKITITNSCGEICENYTV